MTATAYWPAQVGAEVYEHPGFVFAAEARRRAKDDDDWVDFDEALTIVSHPDYPVADAGVAEGRQQYRVEVNPGLARPGFVFDVTLHTGLGAVESFQLSVSLVTVPRVPVGLSFRQDKRFRLWRMLLCCPMFGMFWMILLRMFRFIITGCGAGCMLRGRRLTLRTGGRRMFARRGRVKGGGWRGLRRLRGRRRMRRGFRIMKLGRSLQEGRSVALEFDSLGRAYRPVPPMFAGGGLAWVDAYSDVLRDDGKAPGGAGNHLGLQAASAVNAARIVCVREVSDDRMFVRRIWGGFRFRSRLCFGRSRRWRLRG